MKKRSAVMLLLCFVTLLFVCSKSNPNTPLTSHYDESIMFNVKVIKDYGNGYGLVQVYWLVDALDLGNAPFSFGPLDIDWSQPGAVSMLSAKTVLDGEDYYTYTATVKFGTRYNVAAGLNYPDDWLSPNKQAGSPYFDLIEKKNMAFTAYANFCITPG
jgi:hypothetical protein